MVLEMIFSSTTITGLKAFDFGTEWLPIGSPCLWENASIILQLGFVGLLLLQFIRRSLESSTKLRAEVVCGEKYPTDLRTSVAYKVCQACSILLLGIHITIPVLILQSRSNVHCKSKIPILSSAIMQIISWMTAIFSLYNIRKSKCSMFPWILRTWWLCNFLLSLAHGALNVQFIHENNDRLKILDYADFSGLLASTFLLFFSVRGKTSIVPADPSSITDPLLTENSEKYSEGQRDCPYGKATLFQLVTFSWLNALFAVGVKKPLDQHEVPDVDIKDSASFTSQAFDDCLKQVKERDGTASPSIYKALYLFIRKKAAINAFFAVISAGTSYVGPYLIEDLVDFLSEKKTRSLDSGYLIALGFLGGKVIETISQRQWIFGARQLGLQVRAALISHIYKKGLVLSSQSSQSHTSGEIINMISVDMTRMTDFMWFVNTIWMLPIQISLATYILHINLGLGALVGLAATLTLMAGNTSLIAIQKRNQSKIMESKDARMKITSEVLRNMRTLKLQAWDSYYLHKITSVRRTEYSWIWKFHRMHATISFVFLGSPAFISVLTFGSCVLMGIPLTAGRVLSALATFRMLQDCVFNLPDLLNVIAQGKVSMDRLTSYLQEDEMQLDAVEFVPKDQTEFCVDIEDGKFSWDVASRTPTLEGIQLKVKRGTKVAICGTVGSGKSSLLSCILGEMPKLAGTVRVSGRKAYVPQSAWILSGNVRENILFGNSYESARYHRTVKACALTKDLELFPTGDLTEIGERGINMSGGQKQRIQIARAVYDDADLYVLDDPFSAVDAHTGTELFRDCLMGMLKEKTVIYVTHQVEFLPAADLILVMQNGRIAQAGTFQELKENIGFEILVGAHNQALESVTTVKNSSREPEQITNESESSTREQILNVEFPHTKQDSEHNLTVEITEKDGKLVQAEEREKGSIKKEVYWSYLTIYKSGAMVPIILLALLPFPVLQIASNYWMAWACPTGEAEPIAGMKFIILVYTLLSLGGSLFELLRGLLVLSTGLSTAEKIFNKMLHSIVRAPMAFFDSTPAGRILTRASTDQAVVDLETANKLSACTVSIIQLLGTIAVMSQVAWEVFVIFIPVTAICIWYQQYYIPTARELVRLAGIQQAPILHQFAESLTGAATIRAFDQKVRFVEANLSLVDSYSRPWFHNFAAMEWLSFRLNQLSNFVFAFSLVLLVTLPEGIIHPNIAGLAVAYGINLNVLQATVIWNMCTAENKMISVERILQYLSITSEAPLVIEDSRPPPSWPNTGTISFNNLEVRYAEHLPSVLKNITCTFQGRKKVGVVGRTGSGKSTLIQAIFRVVEPREGSIMIDNIDISKIGLHDLRSRLSIIPQDPTMFEGTVRGNLDPLTQYSDTEIWEALDKCQLGDAIRAKEEKLESTVIESGENWSMGQRQLFCLGRALLKKSSILVLDEATASIDSATDGILQKVISQEFKDRTIVTIAHRVHTVIDSDFVMVLSDGRIAEYDTPARLLERENSFFSKLIKEYSKRSNNLAK